MKETFTFETAYCSVALVFLQLKLEILSTFSFFRINPTTNYYLPLLRNNKYCGRVSQLCLVNFLTSSYHALLITNASIFEILGRLKNNLPFPSLANSFHRICLLVQHYETEHTEELRPPQLQSNSSSEMVVVPFVLSLFTSISFNLI